MWLYLIYPSNVTFFSWAGQSCEGSRLIEGVFTSSWKKVLVKRTTFEGHQ